MSEPTGTGATGLAWKELRLPAKCFVQFRPHSGYKGEFGFDWLREKDNGLNTEPDYETIIESGYKNGISDYTKDEAYEALKEEYKTVSVMGFGRYYVSYLNLFSKTYSDSVAASISPKPPYEAKLRILIEIKYADVDEIKFQFNKNIFSINDKEEYSLPLKTVCPLKLDRDIKITCKKDITNDKDGEILVYAYLKPKEGESQTPRYRENNKKLAGKIIVAKNDATVRKEAKFVFVCVKTNITGGNPITGEFTPNKQEQKQLCNVLYQALVCSTIWVKRKDSNGVNRDIILDLSNDANFKLGGKYIDVNGFINEDADNLSMFAYLRNKFMSNSVNSIYRDCFPIFTIKAANYDGSFGQAELPIGTKNVVLFNERGADFQIIAHEALHGFGLWHTHRELRRERRITQPNKKYVFPHGQKYYPNDNPNATDNVMSYRIGYLITTWNWQWKIVRNHL